MKGFRLGRPWLETYLPNQNPRYQRVFFELLLDSEEMDYNSVIAFGNQKYVSENLLFQGMSRTHALRYSTGAEAAQNPPWISNPDFDGDVSSARNFLWSVENE